MSGKAEKDNNASKTEKTPICGVIMPISAIDGCTEQHWHDIKDILFDSIRKAGYDPNLVSNSDDVGIIQKRIIQNLYSNPLIVCDVSGKNPNVMFELGIRLAFDKPTIIIKDDKTTYSFDTSPIEHLEYPRDLRFNQIVDFKAELQLKLKATYKKATEDPNYTTFLKNFGKFTVAKLETEELPKDEYLLEELSEIRKQIQILGSRTRYSRRPFDRNSDEGIRENVSFLDRQECNNQLKRAVDIIQTFFGLEYIGEDNIQDIIERGSKLGVMPDCFDEEKNSCLNRLTKVIENTKKEKNSGIKQRPPKKM